MQIYNIELGDKEKYNLIHFPGGELHIRLNETVMSEIEKSESVVVTARVTNSDKLIETLLLCDAVRQDANRSVSLILPYLPYGRADRRFSPGDCFGVATFARLINSANVTPVTLDAHSAQGLQHFDRIQDLPSSTFIERAVNDFGSNSANDVTLLFPDKGARQRYDAVSNRYKHVLHCSKERNLLTGKLKGFKVPERGEFQTKKVLIVDDICDGGGTFNGIADSLKEFELNLALYVTHGIFSKGYAELDKRFEKIYTTDSFTKEFGTSEKAASTNLTVYPTHEYFLQNLPELQKI
ncbi:MAG: ribose-phosphate pyrophosphokinase [Cyanobacteria bacterium SZAS-4]|nr:ribose-phosphate pyrophosphokinase [Cyanobacteria bacterium SZAS-4]